MISPNHMKHALITLIIVLLFVLVVVPLIYIALGKLKNPIDFFAIHKVGDAGLVTKKTNFISPNYIPESGTASKSKSVSETYKKLVDDVNNCFNEKSMHTVSDEYFSIEKKEGSRLNIRNDITGTTRYFEDFYPTVETKKTVAKRNNTIYTEAFVVDPGCAKNGTNLNQLLTGLNDTGVFMDRMTGDELSGYDFTDKGVTTINGLQYYWYMFEDKNRLSVRPEDGFYYGIMYSTFWNNIFYMHAFEGLNLDFGKPYGTPRDFLNQTQVFLSGTVYGTSTPQI